jgi:hypothetical protein
MRRPCNIHKCTCCTSDADVERSDAIVVVMTLVLLGMLVFIASIALCVCACRGIINCCLLQNVCFPAHVCVEVCERPRARRSDRLAVAKFLVENGFPTLVRLCSRCSSWSLFRICISRDVGCPICRDPQRTMGFCRPVLVMNLFSCPLRVPCTRMLSNSRLARPQTNPTGAAGLCGLVRGACRLPACQRQ